MDDAQILEGSAHELRHVVIGLRKVNVLPPLGEDRLLAVTTALQEAIAELEELAVVARLQLALRQEDSPAASAAELDKLRPSADDNFPN